jgi:hypothetical protein
MVTGARPYRGQSLSDMSKAILAGVAIPPSQIEPTVTLELERVIARAMARELDQRYGDATQFRADLRALQAANPVAGENASPVSSATARQAAPPPPLEAPAFPQLSHGIFRTPRARRTLRPASLEPLPPSRQEDTPTPPGE